MPRWIDQPPEDCSDFAFRIVRTGPGKPLIATITCLELVGCCTHFVKNRTIPCEGQENCQPCQDGYSWRWHGYVSCVLAGSYEHCLFEMTAPAADTFRVYEKYAQDLRGCRFTARRPSGRSNGRVVIKCEPTDPVKSRLPDPPDVKKLLCHIWNIKYNDAKYGPRVRNPFAHLTVTDSGDDGRNRS